MNLKTLDHLRIYTDYLRSSNRHDDARRLERLMTNREYRWLEGEQFQLQGYWEEKTDKPMTEFKKTIEFELTQGFFIRTHCYWNDDLEKLNPSLFKTRFHESRRYYPYQVGSNHFGHTKIRALFKRLTKEHQKSGILPKGWQYELPTESQLILYYLKNRGNNYGMPIFESCRDRWGELQGGVDYCCQTPRVSRSVVGNVSNGVRYERSKVSTTHGGNQGFRCVIIPEGMLE